MSATSIPSHVPAQLVRDYDYTDMKGETDVFLHFKKLHDGPDIFYTPQHGGHWVLTRYADMEAVLCNQPDFSSRHASLPKGSIRLPLVESDEPLHTDFRNLMAPFFTPKNIGNLEKRATELTISLIDGFYDKGECEFVEDFAHKMPILILASLLDLPHDDIPYLMGIAERLVRGGKEEIVAAGYAELGGYIATKILPARHAKPGEDVFSVLLKGKIDGGRPLTDQELITMGCLLIGAGLDTVAGMLGFIAKFLAEHPAHRQQIHDQPQILTKALEEIMRRHHIPNISRVATRDLELCGVQLKAGDVVMLPLAAAGLDERRYPDPLEVDFTRADSKNLVFGRGPHQCIGAFLARTELRVFMTEWLKRIPHFEVKDGAKPVSLAGKAHAIASLPLTWKVEAR